MGYYTFIQVRVDEALKQEATDVLESIGMDMPTAIRMFLKKVVIEKGLPFETKLPSYELIPSRPALAIPVQEYVDAICQVPMGRVTRDEEITAFLAEKYGAERVRIEFEPLYNNPLWKGIPWWRVVSSRGMLYNQLLHSREEQKLMLEKDGLRVVPCGAYGRSLKVENYKELLYKDFK